MGMILTYDVTDDTGGFFMRPVIGIAQLGHGVQNTPVHGLQAVTGIRNGTAYYDRERVFQIGLAKLFLYIDLIIVKNAAHNYL